MEHVWQVIAWIHAALMPHERDERGDVPGWVMITVMTAGLVALITAVASTQLQGMLESAFAQVK